MLAKLFRIVTTAMSCWNLRCNCSWRISTNFRLANVRLILVFALITAVAAQISPAHAAEAPALAEDGRTKYVIALADDPTLVEAKAASELAEYLYKATGVIFPILPEIRVPSSAPQILVGAGTRVKQIMPTQDWAALGADGIVQRTVGKNLVLAGGRPRGTLYAVYQFLEEQVGVRWWTPTEGAVPSIPNLPLPALDVAYTPPFRYREHFTTSVMRDPLFATRLRENGHHQTQGQELGGHYSLIGFVHTFDKLLPPEKYFKAHPDWYSDAENGGKPSTAKSKQPAPQTSQLCLTNEAARRELTRVALEWIRKNPSAGMISISQNDNRNRCTSDADLALEEMEGSPAGPLLHFVNAVAADIEREFPNFIVETLAYTYTRKPPRHVRPRSNVMVRLCSFEADFSRPLDNEVNRNFLTDLEGWKAVTPNLFVWDYIANFRNGIWPHPNLRVLGPNLRLFAASNLIGVFLQGDAYTNGVGDFVQLRAWLVAHLMWNPQQDEKKLISEFLRGYYGAAAPHLQTYLDLINDAFLRSGQRLSIYHNNHSYLTLDVINQAIHHFHQAERAVAGDRVLERRVRRERLALDHVLIGRHQAYQRATQATGVRFDGPNDAAAAVAEFVRIAEEFGVENHREGATFSSYKTGLLRPEERARQLPVSLQDLWPSKDATSVIDAHEDVFRYSGMGTMVGIVVDPKASNHKAARMTGAGSEWATQWDLDEEPTFLESEPWHCYIVARVEPKAGATEAKQMALALSYGIYDPVAKNTLVQGGKTLSEIGDNEYHVLDLGRQTLKSAMYFYVAPANNPGVEAIYVDRLLLIREKTVATR